MLYLPRKTLNVVQNTRRVRYAHRNTPPATFKYFPIASKILTPILTSTTHVSSPGPRHKQHELLPFYMRFLFLFCFPVFTSVSPTQAEIGRSMVNTFTAI